MFLSHCDFTNCLWNGLCHSKKGFGSNPTQTRGLSSSQVLQFIPKSQKRCIFRLIRESKVPQVVSERVNGVCVSLSLCCLMDLQPALYVLVSEGLKLFITVLISVVLMKEECMKAENAQMQLMQGPMDATDSLGQGLLKHRKNGIESNVQNQKHEAYDNAQTQGRQKRLKIRKYSSNIYQILPD